MPPGSAVPQIPVLAVVYGLFLLFSIVGAWIWAIIRLALGLAIIPRFAPRVVPWRGATVLLVVLLWLTVQVFGPVVYLKLHGPGRGGEAARPAAESIRPSEMMTISAIENATLLVVLPLLMMVLSRARPRDFLGESGQARRLVLAIQGMVAWPLIAPVVYGMMLLAVWVWGKGTHPLERAIQTEGLGQHAWVLFLASVALAPMAEELVFRGAILGWLTRLILRSSAARVVSAPAERLDSVEHVSSEPTAEEGFVLDQDNEVLVLGSPSPWPEPAVDWNEFAPPITNLALARPTDAREVDPGGLDSALRWSAVAGRLLIANVLVSALFASLHFAVWPTPVPIFFLSLVLGLLYQRTGSLVAPVALHMTFNGVSTVLMFLALGATPPAPALKGQPAVSPKPGASPTAPVPPPTTPTPVPIPVDDPAPIPAQAPKS